MKVLGFTVKSKGEELVVGKGIADTEAAPIVSEILYCRDGFNKGEKGHFESYVAKLDDGHAIIVPAHDATKIVVAMEGKKGGSSDSQVELPD